SLGGINSRRTSTGRVDHRLGCQLSGACAAFHWRCNTVFLGIAGNGQTPERNAKLLRNTIISTLSQPTKFEHTISRLYVGWAMPTTWRAGPALQNPSIQSRDFM